MRATLIKVDYPECILGLKDIPDLGYIITREGIKYVPNKLQGIMDLGKHNTTTEVLVLIRMVQ